MLVKKPTFYRAVAGTVATIVMVARLNGQSPVKPPPIDPSPKPYALSVAASGIIEALSENVAIGVPEAGLVTKVHVKVWDSIQEGQPLFTLDNRELQAQLSIYPRANRFAGRSSRRFSAVAGLRCHCRTMMLSLGLSIALMSGCAVGPNYSRPVVPTPFGNALTLKGAGGGVLSLVAPVLTYSIQALATVSLGCQSSRT